MRIKIDNIVVALLLASIVGLVSSCSTTRRIPDDEILYTGVKKVDIVTVDGAVAPSGMVDEVKAAVNVAPNNCLISPSLRYPFPLGLWVYNNWSNPEKGFKHWIYELLVEEPVLVSEVRPELRTSMINEILDDNGYFHGRATYELVKGKNLKKASIKYKIETGKPFLLDKIELLPDTTKLNHVIDSLAMLDPYLKAGNRYCIDSLGTVRTRITNSLRRRGFYFFRPEYIEYLADSIQKPGHVSLRLALSKNMPVFTQNQYVTGDVTVYVHRNKGGGEPDTVVMKQATLIQMMPSRLRRNLIPECLTFRKGKVFSVRDMDRTQTYLSRLGIFSAIDIAVKPNMTATQPTLDVSVSCKIDAPLEASIEANVSSKSNSYLGPGLTLGLTNKNLFGGGEQFGVTLTGSYEWQTGHGSSSLFNSYEVGLNTSLAFPRLLMPKFIPHRRRQLNWTKIALGADLLNRPHYFKMAQFEFSYGYDWVVSRRVRNSFTLFKLTYTKLLNTTETFDSIIDSNQAIALSFRDQFIPQMSYTYQYDRAFDSSNEVTVSATATEAGNIFWGIWELAGAEGEKKLFGTPFSQFVKGTLQVVYRHRIGNTKQWIVSRLGVGAAHAYGNTSQVPYTEQFYVGGANSIRAFTVRSLGPGRYRPPLDDADGYFDQTGTFKFEANVEWRFPIAGPLNGALFVDAGNVWLLKEDSQRPGGKLEGGKFLRDLALGTGLGLRFDISMLVLRADLGIGIHAPYATGERGYYNMESFGKSLSFHLDIGYPF